MKTLYVRLLHAAMFVIIMISLGCEEEEVQAPDRYSFWKGDITNFYYTLDINDARTHKVTGKPYMILEYDPVNNQPLKCEFGLSEAKNEYLPGAEMPIPEPFLSANGFDYADRLNLTGSVSLLCSWATIDKKASLPSGDIQFEVSLSNGETYHFVYTPNMMEGEIRNPNASWSDRVSDAKAFKLTRRFNSNTVDD